MAPGQDWLYKDHTGCYFSCPGERGRGEEVDGGKWKGSGLMRKSCHLCKDIL